MIRLLSENAWGNIRKNRNIYLPYLLAASVMTALFYIQGSLCDMVDISGMKGKRMMGSLLRISTPITGIFSLVILFYVNSFVMKQRKRNLASTMFSEWKKRHLARLMSVEILLVAVFSLFCCHIQNTFQYQSNDFTYTIRSINTFCCSSFNEHRET